jgi:hypothetical protein
MHPPAMYMNPLYMTVLAPNLSVANLLPDPALVYPAGVPLSLLYIWNLSKEGSKLEQSVVLVGGGAPVSHPPITYAYELVT